MNKTIGALIGTVLLAMPGAVSAYSGYPYYQDQCYCSGQGGFNHDPILYSYTPVYGYGGAGYDFNGNYGPVPPTYPVNSPIYSYPTYTYQQPQYSYPNYSYPSYSYPQYQPSYYYPQQQYYNPYLYNTNTNLNNNINNIVNNNNSYAVSVVYGW